MTGTAALISVVMPAYNAAAYLPATVRSVLRQTFRDIELLVIDDGSTDDTAAAAVDAARGDARLRVISPGVNQGRSAARNLGIDEARGDWVCPTDADDLWARGRLAALVRAAHRFPLATAVTDDVMGFRIDASGEIRLGHRYASRASWWVGGAHVLEQRHLGGGDDAERDLDLALRAEPAEAHRVEELEELGLRGLGQLGDLVGDAVRELGHRDRFEGRPGVDAEVAHVVDDRLGLGRAGPGQRAVDDGVVVLREQAGAAGARAPHEQGATHQEGGDPHAAHVVECHGGGQGRVGDGVKPGTQRGHADGAAPSVHAGVLGADLHTGGAGDAPQRESDADPFSINLGTGQSHSARISAKHRRFAKRWAQLEFVF